MHVQTIASVGYKRKFHKHLECRHLESIFFTGPYLVSYCLWSPVLTAPPWFHANSLLFASLLSSRQLPSLLSSRQLPSAGSRRQLPFVSPYHFRIRRDFMSKNPLSGFAPKQTIESSAFAAQPHSATTLYLTGCHNTERLSVGLKNSSPKLQFSNIMMLTRKSHWNAIVRRLVLEL